MAGIIINKRLNPDNLCQLAIEKLGYPQHFFDQIKHTANFSKAICELNHEFINVALANANSVTGRKISNAQIEAAVLTIFCTAIIQDMGTGLCDDLNVSEGDGLIAACRAARAKHQLPEPNANRSESPAELHASILSLREKSKHQHISAHAWLTDQDLKDILEQAGLYTPRAPAKQNSIKITSLESVAIRDVVAQAQKDHTDSTFPYKIPLLLNDQGNHWINAIITVNKVNNFTISITDSLGISENKTTYFEKVFKTALMDQAVTFDIRSTATTQLDGWSCGYHAVSHLLQEPLFANHNYPGNTKEQLNPKASDGTLKTSEQLRDAIFDLLDVQASVTRNNLPGSHADTFLTESPAPAVTLLPVKAPTVNPIDFLINTASKAHNGKEALITVAPKSTEQEKIKVLQQAFQTALSAATNNNTASAKIDAALETILENDPSPCQRQINSISATEHSEHSLKWTQDDDYMLALKLQLAYFDDYLLSSNHPRITA